MRTLAIVAMLTISAGVANAMPDWMIYDPKPRAKTTLYDTDQFKQVAVELERIFTDQHLAKPYPAFVVVDAGSDLLRTPGQGFINRYTNVNAVRYGFRYRVIYVSERALLNSPQLVIKRI